MDSIEKMLQEIPDYKIGHREALVWIESGKLEYRMTAKLDQITTEVAAKILEEKYGVNLAITNRSIVPMERAAHDQGFNDRMTEEFLKRFGEDVIETAFAAAKRQQR